jgi:hypothetical protein
MPSYPNVHAVCGRAEAVMGTPASIIIGIGGVVSAA